MGRSQEKNRAWACAHKRRHPSEARALEALDNMAQAPNADLDGLAPYLCVFCGGWHLGHQRHPLPDWDESPHLHWDPPTNH